MSNKSLDGVLTKKAHTREKFSEEQISSLNPLRKRNSKITICWTTH